MSKKKEKVALTEVIIDANDWKAGVDQATTYRTYIPFPVCKRLV